MIGRRLNGESLLLAGFRYFLLRHYLMLLLGRLFGKCSKQKYLAGRRRAGLHLWQHGRLLSTPPIHEFSPPPPPLPIFQLDFPIHVISATSPSVEFKRNKSRKHGIRRVASLPSMPLLFKLGPLPEDHLYEERVKHTGLQPCVPMHAP